MPESRGKSNVAMVVFDWAGTTVDHGSLAPVRTLQKVFAGRGIALPEDVARRDMGLAKRDHIRNLLQEPEVAALWPGTADEADVEALYAEFIPLQTACLLDYAQVIDGVLPVVNELRARGIKIGGTTGYTRPMLDALAEAAAVQGYAPDASICPEDVGAGRPHPYMCYKLAVRLKAAPLWATIKVGDTVSDVEEGRNAGMWTIALTRSGNMTGLSEAAWHALPDAAQTAALAAAAAALEPAEPHYTAPAVADILSIVDEIEARLARGERP